MSPRHMLRTGGFLLPILAVLLGGRGALAGEQLLEGFKWGPAFAPKWGLATVENPLDEGFSRLEITTDGEGKPVFVSNVRAYQPALDLTAKFLKFWIKVDDLEHVGSLEFRLSSDHFSSDYYAFPVTIYGDPEFNFILGETWLPLTFSFGEARAEGKPDRSAIDSIGLYLADRGKEPLRFSWGAVLAVDEPDQGVVSITFDDGYGEHYQVAARVMAEHGLRGTAYVIPSAVGQAGYLTMHQLVEMQDRWGWDIAAHHVTPFTELEPGKLESTILGIREFLLVNGLQRGAGHLAYPLGKQTAAVVRGLVRKHFHTARMASFGPETIPPADPHLLRAYNVLQSTTPDDLRQAARRAMEHKEWLILMFHHLVETPQSDLDYSIADFAEAMRLIAEEKVTVAPIHEVWSKGWEPPSIPAAHSP